MMMIIHPTDRTKIRVISAASLALFATTARAGVDEQSIVTPQSPSQTVAVAVDPKQIARAIQRVDALARDVLHRTHVPGLAIAVVLNGKTVYGKGFGVRRVGTSAPVDADTVFQIASLSKSVGATVVAREVGLGVVAWNTPIVEHLPWFKLQDPWITNHVTIGDMFSHRSGLPNHAGDDLEDIGYGRRQVLERLRFLPLHSFRDQYAYTNFGLTAAAESVAAASGTDWANLSEQAIYKPLGMSSTSSRFSDFERRANRATGHVQVQDGSFQPKYQRQPDAQSPAGGVSSSVNDMARWMSMVLQNGVFENKRVIAAAALLPATRPEIISTPAAAADARASSYGYGFNVGIAPSGRVLLSHSGAFGLGAATNYVMIPSLHVGIVILSNGPPIGAVEAIGMSFADLVQFGNVTRDWLAAYSKIMAPLNAKFGELAGKAQPANATAASPLSSYVGTYSNSYFGDVRIGQNGDVLVLKIGPENKEYPLAHWSGDIFVFGISNENAPDGSISMLKFTRGTAGLATTLAIEFLDASGNSTFTRLN